MIRRCFLPCRRVEFKFIYLIGQCPPLDTLKFSLEKYRSCKSRCCLVKLKLGIWLAEKVSWRAFIEKRTPEILLFLFLFSIVFCLLIIPFFTKSDDSLLNLDPRCQKTIRTLLKNNPLGKRRPQGHVCIVRRYVENITQLWRTNTILLDWYTF
jgi:hypothetical protein